MSLTRIFDAAAADAETRKVHSIIRGIDSHLTDYETGWKKLLASREVNMGAAKRKMAYKLDLPKQILRSKRPNICDMPPSILHSLNVSARVFSDTLFFVQEHVIAPLNLVCSSRSVWGYSRVPHIYNSRNKQCVVCHEYIILMTISTTISTTSMIQHSNNHTPPITPQLLYDYFHRADPKLCSLYESKDAACAILEQLLDKHLGDCTSVGEALWSHATLMNDTNE